MESLGNRAAFIWYQCRFCFGVSHLAEIDCLADVLKTKPATFACCKTAQTELTLTASHRGSFRNFSLIEQQYLIRRVVSQQTGRQQRSTLQYQLNHAFHFISLLYLLISSLLTMRTDCQQYGLIQEERSIFWDVTYRSMGKKTFMWTCF